jgi:hypothetical protein
MSLAAAIVTEEQIKEQRRKRLEQWGIDHVGDILQFDEPTDEQKQWVLNRLRGPSRSWER